ncbi:uncharacterized protein LOC142242552 [Haematobia irritans]
MAQHNATLSARCTLCSDPDDGNMIGCSKCNTIYHYSCCDLDEESDICQWLCEFCCQSIQQNSLLNTNKSQETHSVQFAGIAAASQHDETNNEIAGSSSTRQNSPLRTGSVMKDINSHISIKKQLQLKMLEEEFRLREEFLRRKYELLQSNDEELNNDIEHTTTLFNNYASTQESPIIQQNADADRGLHNPHSNLSDSYRADIHSLIHQPQCQSTVIQRIQNKTSSPPTLFPQPIVEVPQKENGANILNGSNQNKTNNNNNNTYTIAGCQNANSSNFSNSRTECNLTTTQIMARQCISKDLPPFNGDPREWPIFISAFEQSTNIAGYGNDENLIRLQKCLHGKARDAVRNCLMLPEMVPDIIRTLKMYFGRPECVVRNLIDEVRKMNIPKGKLDALIEFGFAVKNICATIRASKLDDFLINPTLLQELVEKLPPDTIFQWAIHSKNITRPTLVDFSNWLYDVAEATCKVTVPVFDSLGDKRSSRKETRLNAHINSPLNKKRVNCIVCEENHKIADCDQFQAFEVADRWNIVKTNHLCRICLCKHRGHCWFRKQCGVSGCTVQHNPLLHSDVGLLEKTVTTLNNHTNKEGESYFRIVPVTLHHDNKSISIYALMDDGSTLTLLEENVANMLGVRGTIDPLCIRWTGDVSRLEDSSRKFDLKISSTHKNAKIFPIKNVHTVKNLNLAAESINVENIKEKYSYLRDIPLIGYANAVPSMIIGVNNPNLIASMKVREGGWNQPVASKTRLGWTIFGGTQKRVFNLNIHKCVCGSDIILHDLVKAFFSDENIGILPPEAMPNSKEDQRAIDIIENTCSFKDGRYEVGLLWKNDGLVLPPSLKTAMKRLDCLKRRILRDSSLANELQQQISNLLEKKYARKLSKSAAEQQGGKIWYLPTFIVKNPQKPNKVRLVWDAAAKSGNVALNDFLLKGPDLLIPLMQILYKFRIGAVAICGDIAEMFHRIKVQEEDACAQRFLWWGENDTIDVYQLDVLTFGASCSPFISHFIRNKNAEIHCQEIPTILNAIKNQHYVDDYIDSTNTVNEAIDLALGVREVHKRGGFHMRNWASNSTEVLQALGEPSGCESKTFEVEVGINQCNKILGLYWEPKTDVFKINLKFVRLNRPVLVDDIVPTKREVLQVLMSVFDPLGFVSCFMSYLKIILQEIWRCGIEWDQPLTSELFEKWKKWLQCLPIITRIEIPRCYSHYLQSPNCVVQLHTFVDASEEAFAAVCYFRIEFEGKVDIRLVASKSKVAPLQPMSIPRLELQAAVIGTRLMKTVECHGIQIEQRVMWTDSKTVLNWLVGDPRKYKQFVMFRVAEILKYTDIANWRWVPSNNNIADLATKYKPPTYNYKEWFEGPLWLKKEESKWPHNATDAELDMTELRPRYLNIHSRKNVSIVINFDYFSSWFRLCRAIANWYQIFDYLYLKVKNENSIRYNVVHINKAKNFIYKNVQLSCFPDEYAATQVGKVTKGAFVGLHVFMDSNGVIRVKNRAQYAKELCGVQKDPIILPWNHHVTRLIVLHYHESYHHLNHETVINEIRQQYFITRLRVLYKTTRRGCQKCKNDLAKPVSPQIAPLPPARLGAYQRPFTFVGVDYFGPISIVSGRKSLKRWGVIFTCLTIRAIHIEIAHTLTTDSFLMCLRNFMARRGTPSEIYSDNGTNFRGAERFLKQELEKINYNDVQSALSFKGITWRFNPPAAPHMGGAWERLIRSIKTILYKISPSHKFCEESLRCALMEVELIINSRPLTYVSLETQDEEAITPNHFLLGSSNGSKPFCSSEDLDHRMCLKQSEIFANLFWRRWVKEMIPTLTRRNKWFEKVKPIEVGDIVLVVDENAERNSWIKGRVIEVITAKDGQVRRAKVKTINGEIERPAAKLAVLDIGLNLR